MCLTCVSQQLDHNADQLVASLFALSRSCVQAAEMFVKRQEYESGESIDDESIEPDLNEPDPYIEQLPILKHVISQFQDAKRIHQELKESAVNRQNDIKYKYGIYMVPTLHPLHEKHDNEAMSEVDLHYTDYLSIETFILKGLKYVIIELYNNYYFGLMYFYKMCNSSFWKSISKLFRIF